MCVLNINSMHEISHEYYVQFFIKYYLRYEKKQTSNFAFDIFTKNKMFTRLKIMP